MARNDPLGEAQDRPLKVVEGHVALLAAGLLLQVLVEIDGLGQVLWGEKGRFCRGKLVSEEFIITTRK